MLLNTTMFNAYAPIVWTILALAAALGLVALLSPRVFSKLAALGNHWVDTSGFLAKLDTRIDVDPRVLPYSRILGAAIVASVGILAFVLYGR